jgi:hypothetical protein
VTSLLQLSGRKLLFPNRVLVVRSEDFRRARAARSKLEGDGDVDVDQMSEVRSPIEVVGSPVEIIVTSDQTKSGQSGHRPNAVRVRMQEDALSLSGQVRQGVHESFDRTRFEGEGD